MSSQLHSDAARAVALAAGADQLANEFMKYGGARMLTMMLMFYN